MSNNSGSIFTSCFTTSIFEPLEGIGDIFPPNFKELLSWTFTESLGFNVDGIESKDNAKKTLEPARLVQSACAEGDGTTTKYITIPTITITKTDPFKISFCTTLNTYSSPFGKNATGSYCYFKTDWTRLNWVGTNINFLTLGGTTGVNYCIEIVYDGNPTGTNNFTATRTNLDTSVVTVENQTVDTSSYANITFNAMLAAIVGSAHSNSKQWNQKVYINDVLTNHYPLQNSCYDISGNANHGTPTDITWGTQDSFHYNEIYGADKYTDDATGLLEIYAPYVAGVPVVASVASYTKQSEHPADYWNNGVETKFVLGATTYDIGDAAWNVDALVQAADTEHILHDATTAYGIDQAYSDMKAERGEYLFTDVSTANKYKNVLLYDAKQTGAASILIHKYVGNGGNLLTDLNGDYVFDLNNYPVWGDE